jgi:hypothetical protein
MAEMENKDRKNLRVSQDLKEQGDEVLLDHRQNLDLRDLKVQIRTSRRITF